MESFIINAVVEQTCVFLFGSMLTIGLFMPIGGALVLIRLERNAKAKNKLIQIIG